MKSFFTAFVLAATLLFNQSLGAAPIKVLIVDGQNNHDWAGTTPLLKKYLEETGLFTVDVATTPPAHGDMSTFKPEFKKYKVIVSNYVGDPWSDETKAAFTDYIRNGGGLVSVHAADNAFPEWKEYNEMIGLGGWLGRNEKSGPYLRLRDGKWVKDTTPGRGGNHGKRHEFLMEVREPNHPIMKGLPEKWMHTEDELYNKLRGPAENITVLATTKAQQALDGSDETEPMLMVLPFGQGRIFHTTLGHSGKGIPPVAQQCVGFITTFQRGTEWAATGKVTQKVPADFPTAEKSSKRE